MKLPMRWLCMLYLVAYMHLARFGVPLSKFSAPFQAELYDCPFADDASAGPLYTVLVDATCGIYLVSVQEKINIYIEMPHTFKTCAGAFL